MGLDGNERIVQGDSASPVRGACSLAAWHGIPHHTTTHVPPPALPDTLAQACPRTTQQAGWQADYGVRVQQTLFRAGRCQRRQHRHPGVCKRLRFFHGRTAARRQMGKWATVRVGIGMRCHPCVRHHRLLARALAAVASPASEDQTGSTLSWCRSLAHAVCGCASHLLPLGP